MITFNFRDFERAAKKLGAASDQIPYALARSLNDAAEIARKEIIEETWPNSIQSQNKSFMRAALTITGNRATKKNLRVAIVDKLGRGNLIQHADGGTALPKGRKLAVPSDVLKPKRTGKGMPARLKPRALPNPSRLGWQTDRV